MIENAYYPIERFPSQDYFGRFFDIAMLDTWGYPRKQSPLYRFMDGNQLIDTECFSLFPYYWGDNEELMTVPNFVFKPDKIKIWWYKYCLRDAYSNVELTSEDIKRMLDICTDHTRSQEVMIFDLSYVRFTFLS